MARVNLFGPKIYKNLVGLSYLLDGVSYKLELRHHAVCREWDTRQVAFHMLFESEDHKPLKTFWYHDNQQKDNKTKNIKTFIQKTQDLQT